MSLSIDTSPTAPLVRDERVDGAIALITIDRPARRNALSLEVKSLIAAAVARAETDPAVRVIVLTGANGCFVAGTDIAEMRDMTPADHIAKATDAVFNALTAARKPVIAAVEGYALGGGCELALCADIVVAARGAKFGQPEIKVGIMPGAGGTQRLLRTIGRYQTALLCLTGELIGADAAFASGMVSELVDDGASLPRALDIARKIAGMPPLSVAAIKEMLTLGADAPLTAMLALERRAFRLLFDSADQKEGMDAFLQKRPPSYTGR